MKILNVSYNYQTITSRIAYKAMALPEGLPVADIHTVDFYGLINDDQLESEKLLNASKEDGFFYLSFNAVEHDGTMELIEKMYQLNKDLFSLPLGSKMEFDVDKLSKMKMNGQVPFQG